MDREEFQRLLGGGLTAGWPSTRVESMEPGESFDFYIARFSVGKKRIRVEFPESFREDHEKEFPALFSVDRSLDASKVRDFLHALQVNEWEAIFDEIGKVYVVRFRGA